MEKSVSLKKLFKLRSSLSKSKKVVLATGVFDLLHQEHIKFLKKAKKQGDILIVGVESDARVQKLKGKGRPINPQAKRISQLEALESVDLITILPEILSTKKGREEFIKILKPDIYAVSQNTPFLQEKKRIIKLVNGRLQIVHPHNPEISTSHIIALSRHVAPNLTNEKKQKNE